MLVMMLMKVSPLVNNYRIRCMKPNQSYEGNSDDHQLQMDS